MKEFIVWRILFYLRFWARVTLRRNRPYVIGIAGSVGKSSTRNALYAVLKDHYNTKVVSGNSETGVPLGILGIEIEGFTKKDWFKIIRKAPFKTNNLKGVKYLIVEMGIDDPYPPKNMSYLLTIVKPDMSIDLNATATHTQQFEKVLKRHTKDTLEYILGKIAEEDTKIITNGYTSVGIFNKDDERLNRAIEKNSIKKNLKLLTFGESKDNNIYYNDYIVTANKTRYSFTINTDKGKKCLELSFSGILLPPASRESLSSVILASRELGLRNSQIRDSLEKNFTLPKGRSSLFNGIKNSLIIDSSYNSSKSSVLSFLEMLKLLKKKTGRPIVFLMGDMRELGKQSQIEHSEVAKRLISVVDELYCVGPQTLEYVVPLVKKTLGKKDKTQKVEWYKNAIQAALHMKEKIPPNAVILVKGSQNEIFLEEAIKFLLLNQNDVKLLARQEEYWINIKKNFFSVDSSA